MIEYRKYEYCKDINCEGLKSHLDESVYCSRSSEFCLKTAKEFHKWLKKNNFKLVKE